MLTDALISKPPFGEYTDVFSKRKFYEQSLTRYHTSKAEVMKYTEPVPTELNFLANLYCGWNRVKMTPKQFNEIIRSIKNFPARHLAKKPTNGNLNALRKSLFDANLESELIKVMKKKYFPHLCYSREKITANQMLHDLDLPVEVARIVREAWKANDVDGNVQVLRSTPKTGQSDYDFIPEDMSQSEAAEIKSDTVDDCTDQDAGARDQCAEARDVRSAVALEKLSKCTDRGESTSAYSTATGVREGQHTPSTKCNMILGEESRSGNI